MTDPTGNNNDWCTIESDPGIFTEMLEMLQCKCIELNELYSLDDDTLLTLQNTTKQIYGFIFLFQYNTTKGGTSSSSSLTTTATENNNNQDEIPSDLFFAQQVTTNACATQAILSILFNSMNNPTSSSTTNDDDDAIVSQNTPTLLTHDEIGPILYPFYTFVSSFSYNLKGIAISSSEEIKRVHNTFGRAESMYMDTVSPRPIFDPLKHDKSDDVFHFISYVPWYPNNTVYELDGLQSSPIPLGTFDNNSASDNTKQSSVLQPWIIVARDQIQKRIEKIGVDNVKFNLMAMIHDKRQFYQQSNGDNDDMIMNDYDNVNYNVLLEEENMKRDIWKKENERRRHNYIPFIVQYLREMAKTIPPNVSNNNDDNDKSSSLLKQMITTSRTRQQEKRLQKQKKV